MLERIMKRYILNKQVRLKHDEASDKYYAFCIDTGDHFTLNKTGFTILKNLKEGMSIDEIIAFTLEQMVVKNKAILDDTIHFLELSEKNGIIALIK
jgi:hypothetical protein